jgi:monofunctional biosynthetic peptidoglycan transglycosylase
MTTTRFLLIILAIPAALGAVGEEDAKDMGPKGKALVNIAVLQSATWRAVNDGVMGGLSQSLLRATDDGTVVFMGVVSLENNGGFASVRTSLDETDLSEYAGLAVRVFGDGKRYRLRLRTDDRFDGIAYQATFETTGDVWQLVEIPFVSFVPTYRGRTVRDAPLLDTTKIHQIGFMIADKQKGPFRLEIEM